MYAGFRPDDAGLEPLWAYAVRHRLPVLLHTGTTFVSQAPFDYPFTTVDATLAGLRGLNRMLAGTALPRLDEAAIEALIARDTLRLLGPA